MCWQWGQQIRLDGTTNKGRQGRLIDHTNKKIWESTEQYTMQELYGLNQRAKSNQNYLEKLGKSFATIGQFPLLCRDKRHNTGRFLFQTT